MERDFSEEELHEEDARKLFLMEKLDELQELVSDLEEKLPQTISKKARQILERMWKIAQY